MTLVEAVKFPVSPTSEKEFGKDQSPAPRADLQESKTQAWENLQSCFLHYFSLISGESFNLSGAQCSPWLNKDKNKVHPCSPHRTIWGWSAPSNGIR